jgi:hypothetical protein
VFEKVGDLSDFWGVVRECGPFVCFPFRVSLLFFACIVVFYLFSESFYYLDWKVIVVRYFEYGFPFYGPVFFI